MNSAKVSVDLAYEGVIAKCAWLCERDSDDSLCRMFFNSNEKWNCYKDTLFMSCLLHKLSFIRVFAYIFTIDYKGA